ncbi:sporulation phosphorelay system protein KapB [Paenibacillus sp. GCM10027626]|uniref:sporulation phosphorelay system protein KapB n=1 Tax=Paenibacillus sp. GCM10027626 TaxID=3273411 RepID=UPI0036423ACD
MERSHHGKYQPEPGEKVIVHNKTGEYIAEVLELSNARALVKILAVRKHPDQGDLHHPYEPDVPFFHERRALSYTEKTNIPFRDIEPYAGEIPDYKESLKQALHKELAALDRMHRWTGMALRQLQTLEKDYKF